MRVKLNQWQKQDSTSDCRDLQGLQIMPLPVSPQQDGLKKMPREGTVGLPQGALELPPPWGNTFMYTPPGSLWKAAHGKMSSTFSYHFKCYDAHLIFIMLFFKMAYSLFGSHGYQIWAEPRVRPETENYFITMGGDILFFGAPFEVNILAWCFSRLLFFYNYEFN